MGGGQDFGDLDIAADIQSMKKKGNMLFLHIDLYKMYFVDLLIKENSLLKQ